MSSLPVSVQIAVVDDYPTIRDALTLILEAAGFDVLSFGTGEELLAAVTKVNPACVLLDVNLPDLSGFEVLKALGGPAYRCPIILITGSLDDAFSSAASEAGAWGAIRKPFDAEEVLSQVNAALADRSPPLVSS